MSEALQDCGDIAGSEVNLLQLAFSLQQKRSQPMCGPHCSKLHLHDNGFTSLSSLSQAMWQHQEILH